jgi:MFS family permease
MIDSSAMMGTFLGSLVSGWLSDKPRRKKIFLLSFLSITAAAFAHFYVTSTFELCVLRVLIGFGMGGDFAVGHAILGRNSHRANIAAPCLVHSVLCGRWATSWPMCSACNTRALHRTRGAGYWHRQACLR